MAGAFPLLGWVAADLGESERLRRWAADQEGLLLARSDRFCVYGWGEGLGVAPRTEEQDLYAFFVGETFGTNDSEHAPEALRSGNTGAAFLEQTYRAVGVAALKGIRGQYAALLWDKPEEALYFLRDDSSSRTLYYLRTDRGGLVFSTNLDRLAGAPQAGRRLSRRSVHEYLRFLDISTPNTIYEGIFSAEPGITYRHKHGSLERVDSCVVDDPASGEDWSLDEASEALDAALHRSVAERMSGSGTTLAFLSGGIDSSLISAVAAAQRPHAVEALTVGFEEQGLDESGVAGDIANYLGIRHHILRYTVNDYRMAFDELMTRTDYPSGDPAAVVTLPAFQEAKKTAAIALDGTGADTLVGIMPSRYHQRLVGYGAVLPESVRRRLVRMMRPIPCLRPGRELLDFGDPEEVLIRWKGWKRREIEEICGEPVSLDHTRFYRIFRSFQRHEHFARYSALMGNLPDDRIHQAAELTGLSVRFPYFDGEVATCIRMMKPEIRYSAAEPKRVLRAILARYIPRRLWEVPKHGFDFPFGRLMAADDFAIVREYLSKEVVARSGLFDELLVANAARAFISGDDSLAFRVWALITLIAWLENHYSSGGGYV